MLQVSQMKSRLGKKNKELKKAPPGGGGGRCPTPAKLLGTHSHLLSDPRFCIQGQMDPKMEEYLFLMLLLWESHSNQQQLLCAFESKMCPK